MEKIIGILMKLIEVIWRVVDIGDGTEDKVEIAGVKAAKGLRNAMNVLIWLLGLIGCYILDLASDTIVVGYLYLPLSAFCLGFIAIGNLTMKYKLSIIVKGFLICLWGLISYYVLVNVTTVDVVMYIYLPLTIIYFGFIGIRSWAKKFSMKHTAISLVIIWVMYGLFSMSNLVVSLINEKPVFNTNTLDIAFGFFVFCLDLQNKVKELSSKTNIRLTIKKMLFNIITVISLILFSLFIFKFVIAGMGIETSDVWGINTILSILNTIEGKATFLLTSFAMFTFFKMANKEAKVAKEGKEV